MNINILLVEMHLAQAESRRSGSWWVEEARQSASEK